METQIFKIDKQKLERLQTRAFLRGIKILIPLWLLIVAIQYLIWEDDDLQLFFIIMITVLPVTLLPVWIGSKKAKRMYETYELILNSEGVEAKAEMSLCLSFISGSILIQPWPFHFDFTRDIDLSNSMTRRCLGACFILFNGR